MSRPRSSAASAGQASVLLVGALAAVLAGAFVFAAVGRGVAREGDAQRAADLAALAGARAMHSAYARLFEPVMLDHRPNPRHLERDAYLALGRTAAAATARANGAPGARVSFPDASSFAPVRVQVRVVRSFRVGEGDARRSLWLRASAVAELAPPGGVLPPDMASGGGYHGPLSSPQTGQYSPRRVGANSWGTRPCALRRTLARRGPPRSAATRVRTSARPAYAISPQNEKDRVHGPVFRCGFVAT